MLLRPRLFAGLLVCAGMLASLCGCEVGPFYKAPALDIPAAYRATAATAKTAWPARDWWRGFGSPELDRLIERAQTYNFDILAAIARVQQADAQVRISGAPLLPTVSGDAQASWTRYGLGGRDGATGPLAGKYVESRSYALELDASYEVDLWGKLRAQQQSAQASALASRFDQQTVALTAVTSVATTWFEALAYRDRLDVLERNLRDSRAILAAIQGRLDAGTASQLDVAQQAALVQGLEAEVPAFRSDLEQELIGLGILTGQPPEAVDVQPGTLTTLALPEVSPGLPSDLIARRPDVQYAEAELIAANANIRAARANLLPDLSLTGSGGFASAALSTLTGPGAVLGSVTASLVQTIFDNGLKGAQLDLTKGQYAELVADYRKSVVQAFTDVENALVAYRYATEQEALEQRAVNTAQLAADIARAQLAAGTIDIVTSLQTQTTLFSDLDLLVQARLARFQALVSLYKALGGGWARDDVKMPPATIFNGVL